MKIFIVSEGSWDEYRDYGSFSTREKAEAYITMVAEAEDAISLESYLRTLPTIREVDLDSASALFPVFTATGYLGSEEEPSLRVSYFVDVPESRFFVTLDLGGSFEQIYAAEGHGRSVQEAKENLAAALANAAAQQVGVSVR